MTDSPDVVVAGYASIDFVWRSTSTPAPNRTAILTGPVDPDPHFGGCAPIVAMQLARQGQRVGLVSWLGDDAYGRAYCAELESTGVDTTAMVFASGQASPKTLLIYDPAGGTTCCFHPSGSGTHTVDAVAARQIDHARALAITVGPAQLSSALLELLPKSALLAWDVKADAEAFPLELRARLLRQAHVITLNRGELAFVADAAGVRNLVSDEDWLLQRIRDAAAGVVAITSGETGVRVIWPDGDVRIPADPLVEVDPTGAGDAFFAGLLGATLRQLDPDMAGRVAIAEATTFLRAKKETRAW